MRQHLRLLLPLLLACSHSVQAQPAIPPETPAQSSALDSALFYQLLLGELNAQAQEPAAAFSLLLDAARQTGDEALFRRSVQIALRARSGDSALQSAKAWQETIPASLDASRYVLQILLNLNRLAETQEPLKRLLTLTPKAERVDTIWAIPSLYERASDKQLAVSVVQKALASMLTDPALGATAWATLGRMWVNAGDLETALHAAEKGQTFHVHQDHPAWLALTLMRANVAKAEDLVKNHLANAPSTDFRMAYAQTLLLSKRSAEANAVLRNINQQQPDYAPAWLMQGAMHLQMRQWESAESHFLHYLELMKVPAQAYTGTQTPRGLSQAYLSLAQIAVQRKDLQQAQVWLQRVDHPDDLLAAQLKRAGLMAKQGMIEEALTLIHSLPEQSHADIRLKRSTEVEILRDQKLFARARRLLEVALADHPNDTDIVYDLAMLAEKMGDIAEMERLLRQSIASKPDDAQAYNALGYALADRNLRLPEARQLIEKALTLSPGDPFIVDSLAWVAFRMGRTQEALDLLRSAYSQRPDTEIAAHLGEVLWVSGQRDEALRIWREGLVANPDNETLSETLQRLRVKL
ncbi:tetratricopeptide repeat protein [Rhodoferax sp.]|uniref:tetratricopeptide repeat protein n=1 Tax=Rhodoferax sp. TaxID=50421 RepID=UPI002624114F|nr:tetratricopeptide repeat protein [Rhodoferax sp.]MDD2919403.1 tetratricopeptide repeat protein [Rhodoferax sp.]